MKLQDFKSKFLQSWVQFVLMDEKGNLMETCNTLFSFPENYGNLFDEIPFLDSISQTLADLKLGAEVAYPCINVELLDFKGFCDYVFYKIDYNNQHRILWILMNFSDHYTHLIDLQQQRNESVIQKELLEIEKKNAILAGELLKYKNEELKRIQKLKTAFFSKVSHEIRTPINGILGIAQLLRENKDPETVEEYAGIIFETSKHLSTIVNDVLDLSKIESDKISFEKISFDIRSVVSAVTAAFVYLGKEKGIQVISNVWDNVPKLIVGDQVRISQILYNLLSNSLKFTKEGKISLDVQVHSIQGDQIEIRFEIKDTGIGISAENLARIFEPYEQATADTTRNYGGTGLGLHIVQQLIKRQNGSIDVASEPDKGTTFTFVIPFEISAAEPSKVTDDTSINRNLKILVGEDNPLNQKILTEFIKKWGFRHETVDNGHGVITKLGQSAFDLIILDYKMPEMDGLETLQFMRANFGEEINAIPVILFTGELDQAILDKFNKLNVRSVLNKPIEPKLLLDTIAKIFYNEPRVSHFDLHYAIEMTDGNKMLIHDMIDIFITTMPEEFQKMKELLAHGDLAALRKAVHKVKPNFHYMGIRKARKILDLLEKDLDSGKHKAQLPTKINSLQQITEAAIERLKVEKLNWVN
ncbi:ATP-binding protein [Fulvivirgaceae bacterium BMA12]|uniref:histidine kinase n=1 Tax=Agaribacillus aureus TaxID=3051825 RepID=A0ABT8LC36_9BACT|nr:ATP-binding protein [Fulvivirgaceae bacterium BMA12]